MNRHQRRAAVTRSREGQATTRSRDDYASTPDLCPCCNVRTVIAHAIEHAKELRTATDRPVVYAMDETSDCVAADFGVLQIRSFSPDVGRRIVVTAFGEEVFHMTPDGYEIVHPGPWITTLAAIRAQLDTRYGLAEQDNGFAAH